MLIVRHGNLQIEASRRLVKRAEAQAVASALELLDAARKEADDIRQKAQEEFEAQRKLGYEKGMEDS